MPSITFSIGGPDIDISNKSSDQVLDIIKKECYVEEICSKCQTDEDVEQCMECDKYFCIDCDPNEMATYGQGHSCSTMCEPCSLVREEEYKTCYDCGICEDCKEWNTDDEDEDPITYETFTSQYDNDKVMFFKYDHEKYDYSDELYWDKDNNYNYEWIDLVIKEYNLEFGDRWRFDHKHNGDGGFMFWRKHSKRPIIHSDFKICKRGHLWKARRFVKDVEGELKVVVMMVKVKSNLFS